MLTINPDDRPNIENLLDDPIFKHKKIEPLPQDSEESLSLGVFLSLVKQGI